MSENTLPMVADKLQYDVLFLEEFKSKLPSVSTEHLVDGYVGVKDLSKRIDEVVKVVRGELLDNASNVRFFDPSAEIDEKGHRYLSGHNHSLKAERRISKPKLKADEALKFFEEKGLLSKVVDVNVSLSTDAVAKLLTLSGMFDKEQNRISKALGLKSKSFDMETAKKLFGELKDILAEKSQVTINEDKISALVALEEISLSEIEHLFDYSETYALKEVKEK